jgi:DNA-binding beta-propeller fold protein YncE
MIRRMVLTSILWIGLFIAGCASPAAQTPELGDGLIKSASVATQSGDFNSPFDSTPNPDATIIYYTAIGPQGPGVFQVPAAGGAAELLTGGAPFVGPVGIAISSDGLTIYVADPQAGQIFVIPTGGDHTPKPLAGTTGSAPRGMAVVRDQNQDVLYFTGKDPSDGQVAVLKVPAAGSTQPTIVAKGTPLVEPDGLAVTHNGIVYVSDHSAAGGGFGRIFRIDAGATTTVVERVRVGTPAGVALTFNETVLLVSALQPDRDSDQVVLVNLSNLQTGSVTKGIAENQKAGGVHRALNSNVFSWADLTSGGSGRVYRIELK